MRHKKMVQGGLTGGIVRHKKMQWLEEKLTEAPVKKRKWIL